MLVSLIVAVLACWRFTTLLYYEQGPWDCFDRLRYKVGAYLPEEQRGFLAKQLSCFWCISLWVGLFVTLIWWLWWYALIPFAISGAVVLLSGGGRVIWHEMVDGDK